MLKLKVKWCSIIAFKSDKKVLHAVIQALIAVIVRNEYCQRFFDAGGMELLRDFMIEYSEDEVNYCMYPLLTT